MKPYTLLLSFLLLLLACKEKRESTTAVRQDITHSVYASGVVKSRNQYNVTTTVNGTIAELYVRRGDKIAKGQPILRISNTLPNIMKESASLDAQYNDYAANQSRIRELEYNIESAKSKMKLDEELLSKSRALYAQDATTRIDVDMKELSYKTSRNNYNSAVLQLQNFKRQLQLASDKAKVNLKLNAQQTGDYTLRSDIQGMVYQLNKEKGELVSPQMTIAVIGDETLFDIQLEVDERDINLIAPGQKILLTLSSEKNTVYEAKVMQVQPYMNERSKSFTVDAQFTKQPQNLYPNVTLEANIIIEQKANALLLPRRFLLPNDSVLLDNEKKIKVVTGLKDYQNVEIVKGLSGNEKVYLPQ